MTTEEKAKAYDEALEKIREGLQPLPDGAKISGVTRAFLEEVFPELGESEDERIRKDLLAFIKAPYVYDFIVHDRVDPWIAWLEKQGSNSVKWQKNTPDNKPTINHSILMKTTQGIAEGEWKGEHWFQYRWSWTLKDSDVLAWMELSDLDAQGVQKPTSDTRYKVGADGSLSIVKQID